MTATAVTASPFQSGYDAYACRHDCGVRTLNIVISQRLQVTCSHFIFSDPQSDRVMTEPVCVSSSWVVCLRLDGNIVSSTCAFCVLGKGKGKINVHLYSALS